MCDDYSQFGTVTAGKCLRHLTCCETSHKLISREEKLSMALMTKARIFFIIYSA